VVDGGTNSVISTIKVGTNPFGIDVNPLTARVYVANVLDDTVVVTALVVQKVDIHIKPGDEHNAINPHAKGGFWVAVLSDIDPESPFDPLSQVDIPTVEFGPDRARMIRHKVKDISKDGLGDLLLRFTISETGIVYGDAEATLNGETFKGLRFTGTDTVGTVGCKPKKRHKKHHDDDREDDREDDHKKC
jgi:hypothetical protein